MADIDEFVIMPNHAHGIVVISGGVGAGLPRPYANDGAGASRDNDDAATNRTTPPGPNRPTLGQIIAYVKYQSTKQINVARETPGAPVWQRHYYEHIIRNAAEMERIRQYIDNNPLQWAQDDENPDRAHT